MKCEECTTNALEEFLDGELDARRAAGVEAHLAACAPCARAYEALLDEQNIYAAYERDVDATPPETLWKGVAARIAAEGAPARGARADSLVGGANLFGRVREWFASALVAPRFSPALTAAMMLVAIGATAVVMRQMNSQTPVAPPQLADARRNAPSNVVPTQPSVVSPTPEAPAAQHNAEEEAGGDEAANEANEARPAKSSQRRREAQRKSLVTSNDATQPLVAAQNREGARRLRATDRLVREAEAKYLAAIKLLSEDVRRKRTHIDPQVAARFDETLATIDRSIAETRRTVLRQRNDPVAVQYMLSAYAKKVEVMREMAALD
ncbi:MAG TPA: zf-HC2 domain-containing protein [Pyrinomonadaceae bacterium]|nr:zf-HC2 domain-containing protein [Pyrinomonadaceae bacterium]